MRGAWSFLQRPTSSTKRPSLGQPTESTELRHEERDKTSSEWGILGKPQQTAPPSDTSTAREGGAGRQTNVCSNQGAKRLWNWATFSLKRSVYLHVTKPSWDMSMNSTIIPSPNLKDTFKALLMSAITTRGTQPHSRRQWCDANTINNDNDCDDS